MKQENKLEPINDPKELLDTIEQTLRKDLSQIIALYEFAKIDENISKKLVQTDRFLLALTMKLKEELTRKNKL